MAFRGRYLEEDVSRRGKALSCLFPTFLVDRLRRPGRLTPKDELEQALTHHGKGRVAFIGPLSGFVQERLKMWGKDRGQALSLRSIRACGRL